MCNCKMKSVYIRSNKICLNKKKKKNTLNLEIVALLQYTNYFIVPLHKNRTLTYVALQ